MSWRNKEKEETRTLIKPKINCTKGFICGTNKKLYTSNTKRKEKKKENKRNVLEILSFAPNSLINPNENNFSLSSLNNLKLQRSINVK